MHEIVAVCCLGILGAWFLLRIGLAAAALTFIVVLSAAVAGIYWVWTGGWVTETAKSLGILALLVIILGSMRLGIEKLSDILAALLPPPFGTKGKANRRVPNALRRPRQPRHPAGPAHR
jgi:hypothetical protein